MNERNLFDEAFKLKLEQIKTDPELLPEVLQDDENFSREQIYELCLTAVTKLGSTLASVPWGIQDRTIYLAAVRQNGGAINFIPEDMLDQEICLEAVKQNGLALHGIPRAKRDKNICIAAIRKNPEALEHVPKRIRKEISREDYLEVIKKNALLLQYVPLAYRDRKICLEAVKHQGTALIHVPKEIRDHEIYLEAVKQNGLALEFVPKQEIMAQSLENYKSICIAAARQNGCALKFIDKNIKSSVIDSVSLEKIFSENCTALRYFPKDPRYEVALKQFLSQINSVVITEDDGFKDEEMKDVYLVYSHSPVRQGKTIHVDKKQAKGLLAELKRINSHKINLVLLGHANEESTSLAELNTEDVTSILKQNDNIDRVTLLGCSTAKSQKLEQEKEMIRQFAKAESTRAEDKCGMILMSRPPSVKEYLGLLDKIKLEQAYILINASDKGFELVHIQKNTNSNNNNEVSEQKFLLDQDAIVKLQKVMIKGKPFVFPKTPTQPIYFRGGSAKCLSKTELEQITTLTEGASIFDKKHPEYKKYKSQYPFLGNVTIREDEAVKLQASLLKKMVDAIQGDNDLDRNIIVKGYTKALHVDTKEKRMHVTRTHLYPSAYKHSTFYKNDDNIDRKKLATERKATIKEMAKGNVEGETIVKSIKIAIEKRRKP